MPPRQLHLCFNRWVQRCLVGKSIHLEEDMLMVSELKAPLLEHLLHCQAAAPGPLCWANGAGLWVSPDADARWVPQVH